MTTTNITYIATAGLCFGWLMAATECRPFLPVVKLILSFGA